MNEGRPYLQMWRGVRVNCHSLVPIRQIKIGRPILQDGRPTIITNSIFYPYSYKSIVGDDRVPAILQYRPSDLYLTDRKETMAILQKDTHTPLHICK